MMVRKISSQNDRVPPRDAPDGTVDMTEWRRHQRKLNDDIRRDVGLLNQTTPDMSDRVTYTCDGEGRQAVSHGRGYVPDVVSWRVVVDDDTTVSLHEYKDPDSRNVYIKTNAPKGAKITLVLHPKG